MSFTLNHSGLGTRRLCPPIRISVGRVPGVAGFACLVELVGKARAARLQRRILNVLRQWRRRFDVVQDRRALAAHQPDCLPIRVGGQSRRCPCPLC